jgi:hypothetical protein
VDRVPRRPVLLHLRHHLLRQLLLERAAPEYKYVSIRM